MRKERFEHAGFELEIQLPVSSEALIDVSDFNVDERLPYWAELWPSARGLARVILDAESLPRRAIELGCGLALPSLALAHRGVDVLATDYYADALVFAARNAERNRLGPLRTREIDWRALPDDLGVFDLIVASDVVYEARNVEPLAAAMCRLSAPDGQVWVGDPGRAYFPLLLDALKVGGFRRTQDWGHEEAGAREGGLTRVTTVALRRDG